MTHPPIGLVRGLIENALATLYPEDCKICEEPLFELGSVPICPACLRSFELLTGERCVRCAQSYESAHALDQDGCCGRCRREPPAYDRLFAASPYEGAMRRAICLLKYEYIKPLGRKLGLMAAAAVPLGMAADVVAPTPLHRSRRRQRGFNQAQKIAKHVARELQLPLESRLLKRVKQTPPQAGLTRAQRRTNLRGAFRARKPASVQGKRVLLVDDVATTGSTFEACARALKRAGAKEVLALAVARARPEARG